MPRKPLRVWVTAWLGVYVQCRPHGASTDAVDAKAASNRRQARAALGLICGWFWNLVSSEKFCNCPACLIWKWARSVGLLRISLCYSRRALCYPIFLQTHRISPPPNTHILQECFYLKNYIYIFWSYREDKLSHRKEKPETKQKNNKGTKLSLESPFEFPCGHDLWFLSFFNLVLG